MKETVKFMITKEENGDIKGSKRIRDHITNLLPGKWWVSFDRVKRKRSLDQNAYYHGVVVNEVKDGLIDMGFERSILSHENVHDFLKNKFSKIDIANHEGEFITVTRSTTDLSTTEFWDYIEQIQRWATEFLGITIPSPNEQADLFK